MSMGYGSIAKRALEDEELVIYAYGNYDLNIPEYCNEQRVKDGIITIPKKCFVPAMIRQSKKRMPNGKKKWVSRKVFIDVDYYEYIAEGTITVENCSSCWKVKDDGPDVMIYDLLSKIFLYYQETGELPEYMSCHY